MTTQSDEEIDFTKFKTKIRNFEDAEKSRGRDTRERVMKTRFSGKVNDGGGSARGSPAKKSFSCYSCGTVGHKSSVYPNKRKFWCKFCRSPTHNDGNCRKQAAKGNTNNDLNYQKQVDVKHQIDREEDHSFCFFTLKSTSVSVDDTSKVCKSLLVDCGATAHIVTDDANFLTFDPCFKPENQKSEPP